jgi:type I restriction enzyme S subunit
MKRWPTKKLGDLLKIQNGFAFKSELFNDAAKGILIIRIRDLARGFSETFYDGEHDPAFEVKNGDFLIGMDGEFRCYRWNGGKALLNQRVCRLHSFSRDSNADYVFYGINDYLREIEDNTSFVTVKHLSAKQIADIEMSVPPLAVQQRIVKLLDETAELRRLRDQADCRTAALIPALFDEMFGDPDTNPMGWPVKRAGDLMAACEYGTSQKANEEGRGIPVLRMGNVTTDGRVDLTSVKTVELEDGELAKQRLQAGDVLFNRTNSRELVGKTGIWDGRFEAVPASYFIRVRFRADVEHPQHFTTFMNLPFMKRRLVGIARGAVGQANINSKELQSIEVPVPPVPLQKEFAERVADIRAFEADQAAGRRRLDALFQSLLHRAFQAEL